MNGSDQMCLAAGYCGLTERSCDVPVIETMLCDTFLDQLIDAFEAGRSSQVSPCETDGDCPFTDGQRVLREAWASGAFDRSDYPSLMLVSTPAPLLIRGKRPSRRVSFRVRNNTGVF